MTNFIVAGTQRSGTTYIRHCLNSHDNIICHGEVFQKRYKDDDGYYAYLEKSHLRKVRHYLFRRGIVNQYLDQLYEKTGETSVGIKLMHNQIQYIPYAFPMAVSYIKKNNIKVLHVVRRNVLKTHISRVTAMKRNMYHAKQVQQIVKINIDISDLVSQLKKIDYENIAWQNIFGAGDYMRLVYEDFVSCKEVKTKEILDFLEVGTHQQLHSNNVKINPDDMRDLIINYNEMADCLTGTDFEYCLEAGDGNAG